MTYTTASGVVIPTGADAFNPPAQFKTWADKAATYENYIIVPLDTDRTALATPVLRNGVLCYVINTGVLWQYRASAWKIVYYPDETATFTFASGFSGTAKATRSGNVVVVELKAATRTSAWTVGADVGYINSSSMYPADTVYGAAMNTTTGGVKLAIVNAIGHVLIFGATEAGSDAISATITFIVPART